ncbi:MAG TPA: ELWxxDGT repeat protein, partial [Pirellulales bacterium]|nr:ELWxxDGT repeat protein [Pirellulales bacterium]
MVRVLLFERLEARLLLTAADQFEVIDPSQITADGTLAPNANYVASTYNGSTGADQATPDFVYLTSGNLPLVGSGAVGLTPVQIRHAYAIDQIYFSGGTIAGNGAGQTIAIVDAYDDPTIASDLHNFDLAFGIADPPSFLKVSQTGSTTNLPGTDPAGPGDSWAVEISLDVEWAHALAPGANILLVEANTNSNANLFAAESYAANYPGVSVVSNSWSEGEYSGETSNDSLFQTPAGHTGVTFLASSGDDGAPSGYPAYSPNVVAVGGTTLALSDLVYSSEVGWSGSGGGISSNETQPTYQKGVVTQSTTKRTAPDVSFDADPNSGVAIYDSWDLGSATPWEQIGGTSFSSPAWAALIAIADQGRVLEGLGTLDGATQTLPDLYALPSSDFHDITSGNNGYSAGTGYDLVTGRGSPIANLVINGLLSDTYFTATSVTAGNGSVVSTQPTDFVVQFSDAYAASSLQASDFMVNSIAASSFTVIAGTTSVTFHFNTSPVTSIGLQTIAIATSSVTRSSDSLGLTALSTTFRYDPHPLSVVSSSPASGGIVVLPLTALTLTFSEAYASSSVGTSDLVLSQGTVSSVINLTSTTVEYVLSGITQEGTLSVSMAAGAVTDSAGDPGQAFSATYTLDYTTLALPTAPTAVSPAGSLVYSDDEAGTIGYAGDADTFTLAMDAGHSIGVVLVSAAGLQASVSVGLGGSSTTVSASAAGQTVIVEPVATSAGTWSITVSGLSGTAGAYTLDVYLNTAIESEPYGGASDDTLGTAQNIGGSFTSLGGNATRGAVNGALASAADQDWYSFALSAGDSVSLGANVLVGSPLTLDLYDANGNHLATSTSPGGSGLSYLISSYTATNAGTYYVRVTGSGVATYSLVVTDDADLDDQNNETIATAQPILAAPISGTQQVLGAVVQPVIESFDSTSDLSNYTFTSTDTATISASAAHDGPYGLSMGSATEWMYRDDSSVQLAQGETFSVWVETGSSATDGRAYFGFGASATGSLSMVLGLNSDELILQDNSGYGFADIADAYQTWQANHWYKLQVTWGAGGAITGLLYDSDGVTLLNTITATDDSVTSGGVAFRSTASGYNFDTVTLGTNPSISTPTYSVQLAAGATLLVSTSTPGGGNGQPANTFDPEVLVYNSSGVLVASDDNSGSDGRNASLSYLVPNGTGGTYYLQVVSSPLTSSPTTGNYVLSVGGATLSSTFSVASSSVADGSDVATVPGSLTLKFSNPVLLTSITVGAVTVDGTEATGFTVVDGETLTFTLPTLADGTHTVAIAAGAIQSLQGASLAGYSETFTVDAPSTTGLADRSVAVNSTTVINLWSAFSDGLGAPSTLTFSVTGDSNPGLFSSVAVNNAAGTLTLVGAAGQLGAALLTVEATDLDGISTSASFDVYIVDAVNNAPTISASTTQTTLVNTPVEFSAWLGTSIIVADSDGNAGNEQLTLSVSHGTLSLDFTACLAGVTGNDSSSIIATGTLSALNTALEGLLFIPDSDFVGIAQLQITDNDEGNYGNGGAQQASQTILITVAPTPSVQMPLDINPTPASSSPANLLTLGSITFFTATDWVHGTELWKTDGTAAGTSMVADINPGVSNSSPSDFVIFNGELFFSANDGSDGTELWKSDGTAAGTVMVADVDPGSGSASPANLTVVGSTLFFTATDGPHGIELWRTDGTLSDTYIVKDIDSGSSSSSPANLTNVNGKLFFTATEATDGTELWTSDGTTAGTVMVKDIDSGSASSSPANLTAVGSTLYFTANDGTDGVELWKSDGTSTGTVMVKDINSGSGSSNPANLTSFNGKLYFSATTTANGTELWTSDGTSTGTVIVKDIRSGTSSSSPANFLVIGSTLYFTANDGTNGVELWKSDGTGTGTAIVANIDPGSASSSPANLRNVNGTLYFTATDGSDGVELWKSDGTSGGTTMVDDINPGSASSSPSGLVALGSQVIFAATNATTGTQLWASNGTSAGTALLDEINTGTASSTPTSLAVVGGVVYFSANNGSTGNELWRSDGTTAGTYLIEDIDSGTASSNPANLTNFNGVLFFAANDGAHGAELWRSDGTVAGTYMVKDIDSGSTASSPANFIVIGSLLFFAANDGTDGIELWETDGTTAGTVMVKDINSGSSSSSPANLTNVNGTLFFSATTSANGTELWKSDGTAAGTVMVKDINPGTSNSSPANLTAIGSELFFTANDGTDGTELWKSDGTTAGTVMVDNIDPGSGSSSPGSLVNFNGTLFFKATDGTDGVELWKSDGTAAGTVMVDDINFGSSGSSTTNLTVVGNTLYFTANDGFDGTELWETDGTTDGTVMVEDINPGSGSSSPANLFAVGNTLYFTATDGTHGIELWQSQGTTATTFMTADIFPSASSASIGNLTNDNGSLFFSAIDGTHGNELWVLAADPAPATTGLSSVNVQQGTTSSNVNLAQSFTDHADQPNGLLYTIAGDTNPALFSSLSINPETGVLTIRYAPNASGVATLTVQATNTSGASTQTTLSVNVQAVPTVLDVALLGGSDWTTTYLEYLDTLGYGSTVVSDLGFALGSTGNSTDTLPWTDLDTINVLFSDDVNVSKDSLSLIGSGDTGVPSLPMITGFSYNSATHVATWNLSAPLQYNRDLINLAASSITDKNDGMELDGDGSVGTDDNVEFYVLPGDTANLQTVTITEARAVVLSAGLS